jgi:hypothetical protein
MRTGILDSGSVKHAGPPNYRQTEDKREMTTLLPANAHFHTLPGQTLGQGDQNSMKVDLKIGFCNDVYRKKDVFRWSSTHTKFGSALQRTINRPQICAGDVLGSITREERDQMYSRVKIHL